MSAVLAKGATSRTGSGRAFSKCTAMQKIDVRQLWHHVAEMASKIISSCPRQTPSGHRTVDWRVESPGLSQHLTPKPGASSQDQVNKPSPATMLHSRHNCASISGGNDVHILCQHGARRPATHVRPTPTPAGGPDSIRQPGRRPRRARRPRHSTMDSMKE